MNPTQEHDDLSIELDDTGMVVIHDPELLELVSGGGGGVGQGGTGHVGANHLCGG